MQQNKSALLFALLLVLFATPRAAAQQPDTLSGIKTFVQVCNVYKQLPLQLEVQVQNSTNLVTDREDTAGAAAKFYLQQGGSYVSFGELEQVASDSLLLLVSNTLKRMIVYPAGRSVAGQLKQYMGLQMNDSSVLLVARRFTCTLLPGQKDKAVIELTSRGMLAKTSLPKESIQVTYNPLTNQPSRVVQLSRRWIAINASVYNDYRDKPEWTGKLLADEGRFYLVKEQVTAFTYGTIAHTTGLRLPVQVSDRIAADGRGSYAPVKAYHDFLLTQNL